MSSWTDYRHCETQTQRPHALLRATNYLGPFGLAFAAGEACVQTRHVGAPACPPDLRTAYEGPDPKPQNEGLIRNKKWTTPRPMARWQPTTISNTPKSKKKNQ